MFEYSTTTILNTLGTLYYSRFICKLTYHNIFTGNNGMNLLSNYLIDMYPQHLIHSSVPSGLPNFVSIIDNSSISNKMLSCDLESIVFLKPSKVQQSENQESKFDNKWLRSRRNHGYVLYYYYYILDQRLLNYQNAAFWRSFEVGRAFSLRDMFWNALDFSINRIIMY